MGADYSPARALFSSARRNPDGLSLVDASSGAVWRVSEAARDVRRLAGALRERGVSAGARIGIVARNSPWHFLLHVAASCVGAVTVPLSPRLPAPQLVELCTLADVHLVFVDEAGAGTFADTAFSGCEIRGFGELRVWVAAASPLSEEVEARGKDIGAVLFTSGSTGRPRPIFLTHEVLWWASTNFREGFDYAPASSVVGVCAPMSHIGGFNGTSMDVFTHGGTVVTLGFAGSFDPERVVRAIERYRISMMFVVPQMARTLVEHVHRMGADVSSWVRPLVGGDAMDEATFQLMRGVGLSPIHVWGMTETGGAGLLATPDSHAPVGALGAPFPYVRLRIMSSPEKLAERGQVGEMWVSGPGIVTGDDWLHTGDLAYEDESGWVHLVGRAHRMINTGGELVAPPAVETALRELDCVSDAVVVGIPDSQWGQVVGAVLVPASGWDASSLSVEAVQGALSGRLAPWEMVRRICVVDALPLTATGKVDFRAGALLFQ